MTSKKDTTAPGLSRRRRRDPSATGFYSLSSQCLDTVQEALKQLTADSQARCALVVDRTGCVMASEGKYPETMGATAAATIAALNEMVATASSPEVSVRFYGSEVDQIHFVLLQKRLVLCLLYSRNVTTEQVRSAARTFVNAIGPQIEQDRQRNLEDEATLIQSVNYIESKLDELFKDQLH
ncbi:MAG: hypothetical protein RLY93_17385 [Sumerlaeia bacterium]